MADTPIGETVTPVATSNEPGNTTAPIQDNSSADVDAAKREAVQAQLRANQLQNELEKYKQVQADAEKRQLEEKEEFKTLYEQTQSRLKEIENSQALAEREKELSQATEAVFKDYPADVVELAKTAGLSLVDDTESSLASLKSKLDAFKAKVGGSAPVATSNNNHTPVAAASSRDELTARQNRFEGSPMALASARGDESVIKSYISQLPAIQRMKEIAQNGG